MSLIKTALIPMAARPYHKGHHNLVTKATKENDNVVIFASTADRIRKNEVIIKGSTMRQIWDDVICVNIPKNTAIQHVSNPVKGTWEYIDNVIKNNSEETITIYGDEHDLQLKFSKETLQKYAKRLVDNNNIKTRPVPRVQTDNISGTLMRSYLATDDYNAFVWGMPHKWSVQTSKIIWDLLRKDILDAGFVPTIPVIPDDMQERMCELYEMNPHFDNWTEIKYHLSRMLSAELRGLFTFRCRATQTWHPTYFELEVIKLWAEITDRKTIFTIDGTEKAVYPPRVHQNDID